MPTVHFGIYETFMIIADGPTCSLPDYTERSGIRARASAAVRRRLSDQRRSHSQIASRSSRDRESEFVHRA